MKIKIKSREEIEKTLNSYSFHKDKVFSCAFNNLMYDFCGIVLEAGGSIDSRYHAYHEQSGWHWHKDWYEVIEPDLTNEDLMDIELMNEMLGCFLEAE